MRDYITLISDSWKALKGNWGTVIAAIIISYVASFAIQILLQFVIPYTFDTNSFLSNDFSYLTLFLNIITMLVLGFVLYMIFYIPLFYGIKVINLAVSRGYKPDIEVLLLGYKIIPRILMTLFHVFLKIIPYILINIFVFVLIIYMFTNGNKEYWLIPIGIISLGFTIYKYLDYIFIFELIFDEQNLDPKGIVSKSQSIMKGNKGYLIMFYFLIMIFTLLGLLAFLIGIFVTMIVGQVAIASFYNDLKLEYEMKNNPHLFENIYQNTTNNNNFTSETNVNNNENLNHENQLNNESDNNSNNEDNSLENNIGNENKNED